jgi:amidohydrolase
MQSSDPVVQSILQQVDAVRPEVVRLSRDIHANPEIGYEEHQASQWLTQLLAEHGFEVQSGIAELPTAFRATYRGGDGPTIALLAEYDALPGLGHGCGHNLICTAASAAAIALKSGRADLPGTITVFGTPAEEGGGGKIVMLERGAFAGVDVALLFHPGNQSRVNSPQLASGGFEITFSGKSAHASGAPWDGRNAADAAMLFFAGVNALRQHVRRDVGMSGIIKEAGMASGIIPERSRIAFSARAEKADSMEAVLVRVLDVARGAALMTGTTFEYERRRTYLHSVINTNLGNVLTEGLAEFGIIATPMSADTPRTSGDEANVSHVLPFAGMSVAISDRLIPGHSQEMLQAAISEQGHEAMITAAKVLAISVHRLLTEPELLARVQAEHASLTGDQAAGPSL